VSDLHPRARALLDAAKRGEGSLSPDVRARVHRSVLRRAVALGAAVASAGTTSAVSKAAALLAMLPGSLAVPAIVTAVAGTALVVFVARPTPPMPLPAPAASMHAVAPTPGPLAHATVDETPMVEPSAAPATPDFSASEGPIATNREPAPAAPMTQIAPAPVPAQTLRPRAPANPAPVAAPEQAPLAAASTDAQRAPSPPLAGTAVPDARTAIEPHLAEDLALLQRARQALRAGNPTTALSLLGGPGSALDAGPLAEEAQLARISALCQLGRTSEADAATARLLAAWPKSPAANRLREGCAVPGAPRKGSED
jgi:hypothetical protein